MEPVCLSPKVSVLDLSLGRCVPWCRDIGAKLAAPYPAQLQPVMPCACEGARACWRCPHTVSLGCAACLQPLGNLMTAPVALPSAVCTDWPGHGRHAGCALTSRHWQHHCTHGRPRPRHPCSIGDAQGAQRGPGVPPAGAPGHPRVLRAARSSGRHPAGASSWGQCLGAPVAGGRQAPAPSCPEVVSWGPHRNLIVMRSDPSAPVQPCSDIGIPHNVASRRSCCREPQLTIACAPGLTWPLQRSVSAEGRALQIADSLQLELMCVNALLCRVQPAVVLLCTAAIFVVAEAIHAEPLLTCVVAGAVTTNRRWAVTSPNRICIALPEPAMKHRPGSRLPGLHAASVAAASFSKCCSQNAWCTVELMHLAALSSSQEDAAAALASRPDSACRAEASSSLIQEELAASLSQLMPLVYLLFFGLTGASLKLVGTSSGHSRDLL